MKIPRDNALTCQSFDIPHESFVPRANPFDWLFDIIEGHFQDINLPIISQPC